MKAKYVRDHVSSYGKNISKATEKKFGITKSLIVKAAMGDEKSLKQIGDMGKTGERLQMAMPIIRENLKDYIDGTKEYNTALADIYRTGGKAASAIDKSAGDVTLENTRFLNQIEEYKQQLFANLEKETQRHDDAIDIIELQAWIDSQMVDVEMQAKFEGISNKPFLAQMKADDEYEEKKIQHILENGSDSNLSLIPRKQFSTNPVVKLWNSVREIFS
ncbi:MAG: hypothetical protein KME64_00305 [Scytonematopsis contorta HA4267-MV1]|jgi:hypothetical protein|nr:hypothetical protein [Scytonematopsis contorta HA4267-MV1]